MAIESTELTRTDTLLLAIDVPVKTGGTKSSVSYQRGYFLGSGADCLDGDAGRFIKVTPGALSSGPAERLIRGGDGDDGIAVVLYPTKTYAEGAADALLADVAPEDRAMIRRITRLRSHRLRCYRVPPAYTWRGMGLILVNNLQGLISGGPLTPAINKMREQGIIGYKTMMNLYQISSLTFYFGMFASFGHQTIYAVLTGSVMVCAWGSYLALSFFFKDPKFETLSGAAESRLAGCAAACYRNAAGLAG
jgi:hypothetical protein